MTTQNQNWTEPWHLDPHGAVRNKNGLFVYSSQAMSEGDELRIRTCVNACAGMPDPAAEIARLQEIEANAVIDPVGLIASQYKAIDSLQRQVKLLREALQGLIAPSTVTRHGEAMQKAFAALTSTEPKQ